MMSHGCPFPKLTLPSAVSGHRPILQRISGIFVVFGGNHFLYEEGTKAFLARMTRMDTVYCLSFLKTGCPHRQTECFQGQE
jgi:hypothetical protein